MSTENTNERAKVIIPDYIESNDGGFVADASKIGYEGESLETEISQLKTSFGSEIAKLKASVSAVPYIYYKKTDDDINIDANVCHINVGINHNIVIPFYILNSSENETLCDVIIYTSRDDDTYT